eukprot:3620-Heterococcus_DN1.PRE.2
MQQWCDHQSDEDPAHVLFAALAQTAAHAFLPHQGGKQVLRFQKVWSGSQHSTNTIRAGTAGFNRSVGRVVALDLSALSIDSLAIGACELRFVEVGSVDSVIGADDCDSDIEYDSDSDADYDSDDAAAAIDNDIAYQYQPTSTYSDQQTEYDQQQYDQQQYDDSNNDADSDDDNKDAKYYSDSDRSEEWASCWIDEHSIYCVFERLKLAS